MLRIVTLALGLTMCAALPALAQKPTPPVPTPKSDDISPRLIGTWHGPYQSEQASPGELKLVVSKEAGVWKATLQVQTDQPIDAAEVREFKVEGDQVSWLQDIMGMECKSVATLENGTLKGGTECSQGGVVAITASFVLLKA